MTMSEIKKVAKVDIVKLVKKGKDLTFLIGAGCSVDSPSNLPAGRSMIDALIKFGAPKDEIDDLLNLQNLRYEALVEIIRDRIDEGLKLIDYYEQCDKPNLIHFFIADLIRRGSLVLTTNFDYLIEHALLQLDIPKKSIVPVITKEDFKNYSEPNKIKKKKQLPLYKIHGSTKNLITGESTRESLIATIQAFGSNKERDSIFAVEPYKKLLFDRASNKRNLILMGYSGSDDFDIVPTLKSLKNLKSIIWFDHVNDDGGKPKAYEIINTPAIIPNDTDKIDRILIEIKRRRFVDHVYRLRANTLSFVKNVSNFESKISSEVFNLKPLDFIRENFEMPDKSMKLGIAHSIYFELDNYNKAMQILQKFVKNAEEKGDNRGLAKAYARIGRIYREQGNIAESYKWFMNAVPLAKPLGDIKLKVRIFYNLGLILSKRGEYDQASKLYQEALDDAKKHGIIEGIATILIGMGVIQGKQKNYSASKKLFEEAYDIEKESGNLKGISTILNNLGMDAYDQQKTSEALDYYDRAIKISIELSDLNMISRLLNNIGAANQQKGDLMTALAKYEEAMAIEERIGNLLGKANVLNNMATINYHMMNLPASLDKFKQALAILNQLGYENSPNARLTQQNISQVEQYLRMSGLG